MHKVGSNLPLQLYLLSQPNYTPCSSHNRIHYLNDLAFRAFLPLHVLLFIPELLFVLFSNK